MQLTGHLTDYLIVFWSGVIVSFTPCVYPVLPLTAGYIAGANTDGTRWMGFLLSLLYVLGLAVTYSALGMLAALTGQAFGQFQNHPAIFFSVAVVLVIFGLVLLDVIRIPALGVVVHHKIKPKNIWTVFLFGAASGLVIGPCTAPILGALLVYAGAKQNIFHAGSLLFVFSYGVGASLILVGTFSGLLSSLPKSGKWLLRIKHFSGLVLLVISILALIKGIQLL